MHQLSMGARLSLGTKNGGDAGVKTARRDPWREGSGYTCITPGPRERNQPTGENRPMGSRRDPLAAEGRQLHDWLAGRRGAPAGLVEEHLHEDQPEGGQGNPVSQARWQVVTVCWGRQLLLKAGGGMICIVIKRPGPSLRWQVNPAF